MGHFDLDPAQVGVLGAPGGEGGSELGVATAVEVASEPDAELWFEAEGRAVKSWKWRESVTLESSAALSKLAPEPVSVDSRFDGSQLEGLWVNWGRSM